MDVLLMKIPEAASMLGVSRAKLYELIAAGEVPAVRVDGCRRVRSTDLQAFAAALTDGPRRVGRRSRQPT